MNSKVGFEQDWTVVAAENVSQDACAVQPSVEAGGREEVVNAPTCIVLAGMEAIRPPGVSAGLIGMEMSESVSKSGLEQGGHLFTLFIAKSRVVAVRRRVLDVDVLMSHVHISADNDGFLPIQFQKVIAEAALPFHAVTQAAQLVLRIGRIDANKVESGIFKGNHATFVVVLLHAQAQSNAHRGVAGEDGRAAVTFLFRIVPIGLVTRELKVELAGLHFRFLQAKEVRLELAEDVGEAFAFAGPQSIDVPRDKAHSDDCFNYVRFQRILYKIKAKSVKHKEELLFFCTFGTSLKNKND